MVIQEYGSSMLPVFITLGSMGLLSPYLVEGFILFSFILLVILYLIGEFFSKINLRGYFDILLASFSVIIAFSYIQKLSFLFVITGIIFLASAIFATVIATKEIKCAY